MFASPNLYIAFSPLVPIWNRLNYSFGKYRFFFPSHPSEESQITLTDRQREREREMRVILLLFLLFRIISGVVVTKYFPADIVGKWISQESEHNMCICFKYSHGYFCEYTWETDRGKVASDNRHLWSQNISDLVTTSLVTNS